MLLLAGRIAQKADDDDKGHKACKASLCLLGGKQRHVQAVQGEHDHDRRDDDLGDALPDARVGLCVVLAHDLVDVDGLVVIACSIIAGNLTFDFVVVFLAFLLKEAHVTPPAMDVVLLVSCFC